MLGITNPYSFELPEYLGYNITLWRGNLRFLEVVLNREGESNSIVGLYFDGACNYFSEAPLPNNDKELDRYYRYLNSIRGVPNRVFMLSTPIKRNKNLRILPDLSIFARYFKKKTRVENGITN